MSSEAYAAGDVFWAPDPYNEGTDPRPWLVLSAEAIPYAGEEYVCAALTLSDLSGNVEVGEDDWAVGRPPERMSYCSPWVLATTKHDAVAEPQGSVTDAFTEGIARRSVAYLSGDVDGE